MKHIFDNSAFERDEENKNLDGYYEENLDECYEFGGTSADKRNKKTLLQDFIEAMPFLAVMLLFCIGVFWFCFNR